MSEKDKELLKSEESTPPASPLADDQLCAIAAAAERRIEAVTKIKRLALRVTNAGDWTDQGGRPYLQVSGAEKVARLFGISWRIDEPVREEHDDGHFSYTVKGYFSMGPAEIEVIGTRSSKDPFFRGAKDTPLPPSEIDRNDVKKAAVTNCLGNGITRLLGIRNLTWEDLAEAGLTRDKTVRIEYRSQDPQETPRLPNYGKRKGLPITEASVTLEDLHYYLSGIEKTLADPAKAKYRQQNEALAQAIRAEIARRSSPPPPTDSLSSAAGPPAGTDAPRSSADPAAVSDEDWMIEVTYLQDDPDRMAALRACLSKFKAHKTAEVLPHERRAFLMTVADTLRARGIDYTPQLGS